MKVFDILERLYRFRLLLILMLCFLTLVTPTKAQKYVAIPLGPSGTVAVGASQGKQIGFSTAFNALYEGRIWSGNSQSVINIPKAYLACRISGDQITSCSDFVGGAPPYVYSISTGQLTTLLPLPGFTSAVVNDVSNGQQVGISGLFDSSGAARFHATLWNSKPDGAIDLNPPGFIESRATAIRDGQQVGWGDLTSVGGGGQAHALLWTGSPQSFIDLHPTGFVYSVCKGAAAGQQVGYGNFYDKDFNSHRHALLWSGTAKSVVDLHPSWSISSQVLTTNGRQQVGYVTVPTPQGLRTHAVVWSGTPGSAIDLHIFLSLKSDENSVATGIDEFGNIVGNTFVSPYSDGQDPTSGSGVLWKPIAGLWPDHGGNAGLVSVRIGPPYDFPLTAGAQVKLVADGQPDIVAVNPRVLSPLQMTATFNLRGAKPGPRDAIITRLDGSTTTLYSTFTVEEGGSAQPWAEAIGRGVVRIGSDTTFYITCGNRGSVDSQLVTVTVSFPKYVSWKSDKDHLPIIATVTPFNNNVLIYTVPALTPGQIVIIPLQLNLGPQPGGNTFTIRAWTTSPL